MRTSEVRMSAASAVGIDGGGVKIAFQPRAQLSLSPPPPSLRSEIVIPLLLSPVEWIDRSRLPPPPAHHGPVRSALSAADIPSARPPCFGYGTARTTWCGLERVHRGTAGRTRGREAHYRRQDPGGLRGRGRHQRRGKGGMRHQGGEAGLS